MTDQRAQPRPEIGRDVSISHRFIEKVSAQKFLPGAGQLKFRNSVEIASVEGKRFTLRSTSSLSVHGDSSPFVIELHVCARYLAAQEMTEENIKQQLQDISVPLLHYASYVMGFLTREMLGVPAVLPPMPSASEA